MTFADFHVLGYIPVVKILLNIILRGGTIVSSHNNNIRLEISSGPEAFFALSFRINKTISASEILRVSNLDSVTKLQIDNILLFVTGLHC